MNNNETINREYNSFNKIKDESPKFVISLDKKRYLKKWN